VWSVESGVRSRDTAELELELRSQCGVSVELSVKTVWSLSGVIQKEFS